MASGNDYVAWLIGADNQLLAIEYGGTAVTKSDPDFAYDIGISEDGTLWVISTQADPVNGGSKVFWGMGDGTWNKIQKPTRAAMQIAGTTPGKCIYLAEDGMVIEMNTNGDSAPLVSAVFVTDIDYGGGNYWAMFGDEPGDISSLHFAPVNPLPLMWKPFKGSPDPTSVSGDYSGDCYALESYTPMWYSKDGSSSGVFGTGANGVMLQISCKNWAYALSNKASAQGNEVLIWEDENGGMWSGTNIYGVKVLSTYYLKNS